LAYFDARRDRSREATTTLEVTRFGVAGFGPETTIDAGATDAGLFGDSTAPFEPSTEQNDPVSVSSQFVQPRVQAVLKRSVDVGLALFFLVILTPVVMVLALVLKLTSTGPVFFRQPRIGRGGRPFSLLKFRTMRTDAEERLREDPALYDAYLANNFKLPGRDPRLTPLGRHLRKMSVDEIPQLLNVVAGHMSLVGPRPVVPDELVLYGDFRHAYVAVRPGLTGAWQIGGRSRVGYPERAMIDYDYVSTWSLKSDLRILLKTVPAVVRAHGAS